MFAKPMSPVGVSCQSDAHVRETPAEGEGFNPEFEDRERGVMYPNAKDCPRPPTIINKAAHKAAVQLRPIHAVVEALISALSQKAVSCAMRNSIPSRTF